MVLFWSARLSILRKFSPLHVYSGLHVYCFSRNFPPARLFHPARLFGTLEYMVRRPNGYLEQVEYMEEISQEVHFQTFGFMKFKSLSYMVISIFEQTAFMDCP